MDAERTKATLQKIQKDHFPPISFMLEAKELYCINFPQRRHSAFRISSSRVAAWPNSKTQAIASEAALIIF